MEYPQQGIPQLHASAMQAFNNPSNVSQNGADFNQLLYQAIQNGTRMNDQLSRSNNFPAGFFPPRMQSQTIPQNYPSNQMGQQSYQPEQMNQAQSHMNTPQGPQATQTFGPQRFTSQNATAYQPQLSPPPQQSVGFTDQDSSSTELRNQVPGMQPQSFAQLPQLPQLPNPGNLPQNMLLAQNNGRQAQQGSVPQPDAYSTMQYGNLVASTGGPGVIRRETLDSMDEGDRVAPLVRRKTFRRVVSRYDPHDHTRKEEEIEILKESELTHLPVVYRKFMDAADSNQCLYEEVEIRSPTLKNILDGKLKHVGQGLFDEDGYAKLVSPFEAFVFNWSRLETRVEELDEDGDAMEEPRQHLHKIMQSIRAAEPRRLRSYFKERQVYRDTGTITFAHVWTLFCPGTKVYAKSFLDDWQMFEVQHTKYRNPPGAGNVESYEPYDRYSNFDVYCAAFDWDGSRFRRYSYVISIERFDGRKQVSHLACYPTSSCRDKQGNEDASLKEKLAQRGHLFKELCTSEGNYSIRRYSGPALVSNLSRRSTRACELCNPRYSIPVTRTIIMDQDVIIDNAAFMTSRRNDFSTISENPPLGAMAARLDHQECPCTDCRKSDTRSWPEKSSQDISEQGDDFETSRDRLLLCPPKVLGYVPGENIWVQFRVKNFLKQSEPAKEVNKTIFDKQLELDENKKAMLSNLVEYHQAGQEARAQFDLIERKGRGLTILLHGPPGVGKTLTAEAMALKFEKPLLQVSVADMGTEPAEAGRKLTNIFADASRWKAILLIDEADVFLQVRGKQYELEKGMLVSVLLRALEYHDGIVFLTTNRINSLDVAIQSRMNLAIQYGDLSKHQQQRIFMQLFDQIKDKISDRAKVDEYVNDICTEKGSLNGRQIRNIVSSALAMSERSTTKLSKEHIRPVYDATINFVDCLGDLTKMERDKNEAGGL